MQERLIERQSSALADMVAPLQLTVGAATSGKNCFLLYSSIGLFVV